MELWDVLLIVWWLLAAITILPVSWLTRHLRATDRKAAITAYLRGQTNGHRRFLTVSAALPSPAYFALAISSIVLFFGYAGLLFIHTWTRLLVLNFQFVYVWIGAACLWAGLSRTARKIWQSPKALRIFLAPFGTVILAGGLYAAGGDVILPRSIVEGRVDKKEEFFKYRSFEYLISVNGNRHEATRVVYLSVHAGERIRAELGAVSKRIFRANKI